MALQSQASIFHIHSPEFIRYGVRLKRQGRGKVIFDFREDYEAYVRIRAGIPALIRAPLALFVRKQLEWGARNADAVVVADEGTAELFTGCARKILVLHNFPRLDLFPYKEHCEQEKLFDIVHHGSTMRLQLNLCLGIDDALVRRGTRATWRLITKDGPDMAWLRAELKKRGALDRFTIDPMIPHERVAEEVRKARMGISLLPDNCKFQKNIPRKVFEFMALGMPVVMADLPPTRRFVRHDENALPVPPDDCDAFAQAITRLLKNPDLRRRIGAGGRETVERECNWEMESKKLLSLYSELLGDRDNF
jgi:glycosyltransferase involved in cell wall biosynthesis